MPYYVNINQWNNLNLNKWKYKQMYNANEVDVLDYYTKIKMSDYNKIKDTVHFFHKIRKGLPTGAIYQIDDYIGYCNSYKRYYVTNMSGYLGDNTPPIKPSAFVFVENDYLTDKQIKTFNNKYGV